MNPTIDPDQQRKHIGQPLNGWRLKAYTIIFEADTPAGKRFDLWLLFAILLSVAVVFADSVEHLHLKYGTTFKALE